LDRVCRAKERELASFVAAGKLPAKGKVRLKFQFGAFDDLLWHKADSVPKDYLSP
jgi:hypothetical protein